MSQEQQKKTRSAKNAPQKKQMQKHPNPRRPRGSGGKTAAQVIVSLVLVALVGYEGFHMYRSFTPISQGSESMDLVGGGSESEAATEPKTVYENVSVSNEDVHAGDLILVNTDTAYVEENPTEIVSIYDHKTDNYHVSGTETSLRQPALDALNQMLDAFYVATGHQDMIVISGYRTTQQQQELYDADLAETGEQTSTRVALPDTANTKAAMPWTFPCTPTGCSTTMTAPGNMPGSTRIVRTTAMYCAMQRTSRRPLASRQSRGTTAMWDSPTPPT